jgi:regulator of RNase E activity RraB
VTSEITHQLHLTDELVTARLSMGDNPNAPREVDHHARFRRMADARAAAAALTTAGYDVETSRQLFRPLLEASHVTAVDHQTAAAFTREVVSIVEQCGGEYGGWGSMIVDENG